MQMFDILQSKLSLVLMQMDMVSEQFLSFPTQPLSLQEFVTFHPVESRDHLLSLHLYDLSREIASIVNLENSKAQLAQSICKILPQSNLELLPIANPCEFNYTRSDITSPRLRLFPDALPKSLSDVRRWEISTGNAVHNSEKSNPVGVMQTATKLEVEFLLNRTLVALGEGINLKPVKLHDAYFRYSGTVGQEYILDLDLADKNGCVVEKRVSALLPHLQSLFQIEIVDFPPQEPVEFVIPLSGVNDRLYEFLDMYEELCLKPAESCNLNLVTYGESDTEVIRERLNVLRVKYPFAALRLIAGKGRFSRGRALSLGLATLSPTDLVFICDVDMEVESSFLRRCRRNTVREKRVYYPEFFKYYNMDYVYKFGRMPWGKTISRQHGHWALYSYGMLCIYKADYDLTGGFSSSIEGWGGEDVDLARRVLKNGFDVMRVPDPALLHRYHDKVCSTKLTPTQFSHCISSRNEDLADRTRLAEYVFYLEGKCNIKKWNLWS